jgi:hypothetical protein
MALAVLIAVNAVLCLGVIAMVVAPLVWAILTQDRDVEAAAAQRQRRARTATQKPARPAPRPRYRPIGRPA